MKNKVEKMTQKLIYLQFMPYFPPHKGGVEDFGYELARNFASDSELTKIFVNIVSGVGISQAFLESQNDKIIDEKGQMIGYKKDGFDVYILPSFDIIPNFVFFVFWKPIFWHILKYIVKKYALTEQKENVRVLTHTRFFVSSLLGGLFAKFYKIKWVHIEHGSSYVQLSSSLNTKIAYFYDRLIGKNICKYADVLLAISEACKSFVQKEFIQREIGVFYRGFDIAEYTQKNISKTGDIKIVFVGRLVALKGVKGLVEVYNKMNLTQEMVIIGDGDERQALELLAVGKNISFLGFKNKNFIIPYLLENNCILVNPSLSEGLPTTVLEGLFTKNVVVASRAGGTAEISDKSDLLLFDVGDMKGLEEKLKMVIKEYYMLQGQSYGYIKEKFDVSNNKTLLYKFIV